MGILGHDYHVEAMHGIIKSYLGIVNIPKPVETEIDFTGMNATERKRAKDKLKKARKFNPNVPLPPPRTSENSSDTSASSNTNDNNNNDTSVEELAVDGGVDESTKKAIDLEREKKKSNHH